MKTSDFGKGKGVNYHPTPPYGLMTAEKQDKPSNETFITQGKKFPDSQDLMGGPMYRAIENLSKEQRAAYSKSMGKLIEEGTLWSEGRFHS